MKRIKKGAVSVDIWFDEDYIECPNCGEPLTNILTENFVEQECDECGKKFAIIVRYYIKKIKKFL